MTGVLISTIYEKSDSTKLSIRDFNIQKIYFLLDKNANDKQLQSISLIKKTFGNVIEIIEKKVELYDILSVSKDIVKIIDSIRPGDKIYVDITQGRKTQALGLLLACYSRASRVENIVYWNDKDQMTILPKFSFNVNKDEKGILIKIERDKISSLIKSLKISKATFYRAIKKLNDEGLIKRYNGKYTLTDAGRIAIL